MSHFNFYAKSSKNFRRSLLFAKITIFKGFKKNFFLISDVLKKNRFVKNKSVMVEINDSS